MCLNLGTKVEQCASCRKYFGSTRAGDAHRVGEHGVTSGPNRRRCMTTEEMHTRIVKRGALAGLTWFAVRQDPKGCDIWVVRQAQDPRWIQPDRREDGRTDGVWAMSPTRGSKSSEMDLEEAA